MRIMQTTTLNFLLVSVVPSAMIMNRSFLAPLQAHLLLVSFFCDMVKKIFNSLTSRQAGKYKSLLLR